MIRITKLTSGGKVQLLTEYKRHIWGHETSPNTAAPPQQQDTCAKEVSSSLCGPPQRSFRYSLPAVHAFEYKTCVKLYLHLREPARYFYEARGGGGRVRLGRIACSSACSYARGAGSSHSRRSKEIAPGTTSARSTSSHPRAFNRI